MVVSSLPFSLPMRQILLYDSADSTTILGVNVVQLPDVTENDAA
jgi:hypothetical protein